MPKPRILTDLQVLGGPTEYQEPTFEAPVQHLQEVTRACRHLKKALEATEEEAFIDELSAAMFHLERVKADVLQHPIPVSVKIKTAKIPYE